MKAVIYDKYGDSSVLEYRDLPKPEIRASEVLIKTVAVGVNPVDWKIRAGYLAETFPSTLPIIPGWDVAGTIEAVGSEVKQFQAGDEVFSYTRPAPDMGFQTETIGGGDGTHAEFCAVPAWKVCLKPKKCTLVEAAGIPLASLTAWQGLFVHLKLKAGDTVAIAGASGGVGSFAVQFAKAKGLTVIGVCSTANVTMVKNLGADTVIDYKVDTDVSAALQKAYPSGVDGVYDCVGGDSGVSLVPNLNKDGRIVTIASGKVQEAAAAVSKKGMSFLVQPSSEQLQEIATLWDEGKVKLGALTTLPFTEVVKAQTMSESGRTQGKIVLEL